MTHSWGRRSWCLETHSAHHSMCGTALCLSRRPAPAGDPNAQNETKMAAPAIAGERFRFEHGEGFTMPFIARTNAWSNQNSVRSSAHACATHGPTPNIMTKPLPSVRPSPISASSRAERLALRRHDTCPLLWIQCTLPIVVLSSCPSKRHNALSCLGQAMRSADFCGQTLGLPSTPRYMRTALWLNLLHSGCSSPSPLRLGLWPPQSCSSE
mmetsp:Transcript_21241/g.42990  ORF Transcript_21241/g.42990 Transcript_21241/m.42990 type:complete len:211 (-) Transcript_21241:204-836(-)